jgi:hypothetical protein
VDAAACVVTARVADVGEGRTTLQVTPDAPVAGRRGEEVADVVARTGGVMVTDGEASRVVEALRAGRGADRTPELRHPMRSLWWMLPFALCLAGEWWLRRRGGLR